MISHKNFIFLALLYAQATTGTQKSLVYIIKQHDPYALGLPNYQYVCPHDQEHCDHPNLRFFQRRRYRYNRQSLRTLYHLQTNSIPGLW